MSIEIIDCLKRQRDICVKNVIPSQNTAFMFTPALMGCSVPALAVKVRLHRAFSPISARRLCHADEAITRPKQLSMAATARVIWLCACVRYWPDHGLVFECVTFFYYRFTIIRPLCWYSTELHQHGGSILGSVNLCRIFRRIKLGEVPSLSTSFSTSYIFFINLL